MTDNISRMYELAGVEKIKTCYWNCQHSFPCKECCIYKDETVDFVYPPFTDTKQLNLIKYFSKNIDFLELSHNGEEFEFYSSCRRTSDKDFSQALASFIYYKWDDLTDTQREEVRGILE